MRRVLHFDWLEVVFALSWIGALSVYWIRIKMSTRFQSLLALEVGKPFPLSVIWVMVIYVAALTAILWAGLCLYLVITRRLNLRRLVRGLWLILIVVVPSLVAGIFLKGLSLSPPLTYLIQWLPLLLALWLSMRAERRDAAESLA